MDEDEAARLLAAYQTWLEGVLESSWQVGLTAVWTLTLAGMNPFLALLMIVLLLALGMYLGTVRWTREHRRRTS
jgi:anion-transporting  ArsA/GET3 family ATPase